MAGIYIRYPCRFDFYDEYFPPDFWYFVRLFIAPRRHKHQTNLVCVMVLSLFGSVYILVRCSLLCVVLV